MSQESYLDNKHRVIIVHKRADLSQGWTMEQDDIPAILSAGHLCRPSTHVYCTDGRLR